MSPLSLPLHSLEPAKPAPGPTRIKEPNAEVLQTPYTAAQLALRYGFPVLTEPSKFWVAIIELSTPMGTGYSPKDVTKYCKQLGIKEPPTESIDILPATNKFTGNKPGSADGEYALDIQVVAGATLGNVGLLLINAPNRGGFQKSLKKLLTYKLPDGGQLSAVSYSWGLDERNNDPADMKACDSLMEQLLEKHITTFTASGDDGSRDDPDGNSGQLLNVDYPSSSPYAFGCGGTTITPEDFDTEIAWTYGGGGISQVYDAPPWQAPIVANEIPKSNGKRCVPDGAMDADPNSGYTIILNGRQYIFGGTSAVAPMWAAWKAATDAVAGENLKFSAEAAYALKGKMTDITEGTNGAYKAKIGCDLCTGIGVPNEAFTKAWLAENGVTYSPKKSKE
ncbi:subtilisin-like protein [Coccomyxa subellipsoidea C-169]|uniref:Subtilisin-like protein n=1 Tax=Coccomyxa subellipsoidea (strain C-169) TaxID=574566 RepID=I0YNJ1_COCSC|nr:subtilisin-like protein [Coccomyxa subellipsoidea C-169]EIE19960.1 subtilisin-like protein [Coccomyxa subellipsoidea C-169]|eukprot:XP_005644504.1 subtilisin-like protein [Coccomyxa subellipsoidea C-169]